MGVQLPLLAPFFLDCTTLPKATHHGPFSLNISGKILVYDIVRCKRKHLTIIVHRDGKVVVRTPRRMSLKSIHPKVIERGDWIVKHLTKFDEMGEAPKRPPFAADTLHKFLGRSYTLQIAHANKGRVEILDDSLIIYMREKDAEEASAIEKRAEKLLYKWYRERAREIFTERMGKCLLNMPEFSYDTSKLKLRRMKSRWGSCTSTGNITLNVELVRAEVSLIDYVITHELCHLKEPNHSKKYYALLAKYEPNYKTHKLALKKILL